MKVISGHIKEGTFKHMYLLYGEEKYLVNSFKGRLREALVGEDTMNYSYYEGAKLDVEQIIDIGNTIPFFAERRLIIIENSGFFKSGNDKLVDYIKNLPEYLYLVFVEEDVDKRNKMYKAVNELGYVSEMKLQDEAALTKWIVTALNKDNKKITKAAVDLMLDKCGSNMDILSTEIEKLVCYCIDKEGIDTEDVEALCTTQVVGKIFDMVTAMSSNNTKKALELYYDLLLVKEPPMRIMFLIARQFNLLLQVKEYMAMSMDNKTMASKMGVAPFVVNKMISQAKTFTSEELKNTLQLIAGLEEDVKVGNIADNLAVELVILGGHRLNEAR